MADGRRRAGGRAARVAQRAAPLTEDARAIRPGMSGGRFRPLPEQAVEDIVDAALTLLEELGMGQATPEFVELVVAAGGSYDGVRLRFPRSLVREMIEVACREFTLYGWDDSKNVVIGDDRVHFATSGAAVLMLDHGTRRFRHSQLRDIYDCARVADTLDNIHVFIRTVVPRDLELSRDIDINTAYAVMVGTSKPSGTSMFHPDHVHEVVAMYDMALGGEGEFRKRPFAIANNTFVVPPLRFAEDSALALAEQAKLGMPVTLLSAGQAGATSPAALAGSLAQELAECLAALTCVNLISPGHPCTMGMWPFVSDLRTGAMSGGSGEEAIINAAAAQVINSLGLPSGVAAGMSDSKLPDNQAGHEKANAITLAANAGSNIVYESAGMLASLLACSLEALVIDNDMLGAIMRTVRGIEVTPESLSLDVIREVVNGAGHFLGHPQTLARMQSEYTYPDVGNRLSPENWIDAGARSVEEVAHERVTEILATHHPDHVDPARDAAIRERFGIRLVRS
jgi:trimethylamine--corrinoid protein Co-methyltransferase